MDRKLPEALTASKEFSELTARQRKGFEANLVYISRIVNDIDEWLAHNRPELTPKHFFDELELDVLTVQSLPDTDNLGGMSSIGRGDAGVGRRHR